MVNQQTSSRSMQPSQSESNAQLVGKIKASKLYQSYEKAFQTVTGLPLMLQPSQGSGEFVLQEGPQNRFCQLLNKGRKCSECSYAHAGLMRSAQSHAETCECFAGLHESAVPVLFGEKAVALLRTGQVFYEQPKVADFETLVPELIEDGYDKNEIEALRAAFVDSTVISKSDFKQITTLLAVFSLQLSTLINQLVLAKNDDEPQVISAAKQLIRERLHDRLSLEEVATTVGVSSFYFCKLFKQTTGMTFTEYVNRKRVECAKTALLKPHARVTEVAFDVGYQSLSQFNRSFLKYAGESPTQYRKHMRQSSKQGAEVLAC